MNFANKFIIEHGVWWLIKPPFNVAWYWIFQIEVYHSQYIKQQNAKFPYFSYPTTFITMFVYYSVLQV